MDPAARRLRQAQGRQLDPGPVPQDFTTFLSTNTENGDLDEAGAGFTFKEFAVDGFWSRFNNDGSYLFRMYRGGARADWNASVHAGLAVEWSVDRYLDYTLASQSYRADRIGVYLKRRPNRLPLLHRRE